MVKDFYQSHESKPRYTLTRVLVRGALVGLAAVVAHESWIFLTLDLVGDSPAPWFRYTLDAGYGAMGFLAGMCTDKNV